MDRGRREQRTGRGWRIAEGEGEDFTWDPRRLVNVTKERETYSSEEEEGEGEKKEKKKGIYRTEDGNEGGEKVIHSKLLYLGRSLFFSFFLFSNFFF